MATRASSRRSNGGADQLNRATLAFLPFARLKEECVKRDLPVNGNAQALCERLEDFLDGVYVSPVAAVAPIVSTPSTSRHPSTNNTPKSRPVSAKSTSVKRIPRRKNSVGSVGEDESTGKSAEPPIKKLRLDSVNTEQPSRECSILPKDEDVIEEEFSITVVSGPQFDSDDDEPLIRVRKDSAVVTAADLENVESEEKEVRKKKKKRRKEDADIESGAMLTKGDSEWVPPEESERRATRVSAKKRSRRNTLDAKEDEEDEEEPSASSMPQLDPEIYDQEGNAEDDVKHPKTLTQRKSSTIEDGKKAKREEGPAIDRPRSISIGSPASAVSKVMRRESAGAMTARPKEKQGPPKEKPMTTVYAEMMKKKAADEAAARAAAATAIGGGGSSGGGTPTATASSVVVKADSQEKESSGGASPLTTEKAKVGRRGSMGAAGSPAADGTAKGGFSMAVRKNAPPRPAVSAAGVGPLDLLGDIIEKQHSLLEKKPKSFADVEYEKARIVSQIKQRAMNTETVNKEKERVQREEEERRKAREERERMERERKISVIAAPTRPIPPPPPPPPAKKHDVSPSEKDEDSTENVKEEANGSTPKYEPLDDDGALADVKDPTEPEYELLSPGPSVPPMDRSVVDDHHRKMHEKLEARRKSHGLVALEVPKSVFDDPFLRSLSSKLKKIKRQRDDSPIPDEIRECMEDLMKKVESKVEKELKWERKTKRKSEYQVEREKEEEKRRAQMMLNPRDLLARATNILENMNSGGSIDEETDSPASASAMQISQDLAEPGTYEEEEEEKPLPEFHGDPVPSDDDEALFNEAAGIPKKDRRSRHIVVVEEEAPPSHEHILMDYYNACLHIKSATDKPWLIEPDNENGMALMWGGVRSNHGYLLPWKEDKKCLVFQIKITEHQSVRHIPFSEQDPHDVRIGFSLRDSPNIMGEAPLSWAFSTTGKKCVNNIFQEWGEPVEIGEIVTAVLDFSAKCISYYKNDECMGVAFTGITLPEENDAVYAHVCVKNCKVAVNLGEFPEVDGGWGAVGAAADPEWLFPVEIERRRFEMSRLPPSDKAACMLIMMVGLPGVGKSTWVRKYLRDFPQEKWNVISAEAVMSAMKVHGVTRARAHTGRWDMVLGLVAKALHKMVLLAARRRRNYIVDMSNVSKDSRKRRLMHFKDFTKKCVVIIPDEEEMVNRQMRQARQEGVGHVPAEAILEMKAVFTIPTVETEDLTDVHFIEPPEARIAEAIETIRRFNDEGKPWFQKRYRGRGSRRGGRGGYMGGDRRGSDFNRPLSVNTGASNGSGPPTHRSVVSPGAAWGVGESPSTAGNFSWASRKSSN